MLYGNISIEITKISGPTLPAMKHLERYYKILIQHFVAARTIILLSVIPRLFVDDNGSKDRAGKV